MYSGLNDETDFLSKGYNNPDEAAARLADINAATDGLREVSEDNPENFTQLSLGDGLIREGFLYKTNRDGMQKFYFILTNQFLTYCAEKILLSTTRLNHKRSLPLSTVLIR